MGTPVERQNLSIPFFVLALLLVLVTGWIFYDELATRRPWRDYQSKFFAYQAEKLQGDLAYAKKELEKPDIKKKLEELEVKIKDAQRRAADPAERAKVAKLKSDLDEANIAVDDADLKVKFAKSELDGAYYRYREAEHDAPGELPEVEKDLAAIRARIAQASEEQQKKVAVRDQLAEKYDQVTNAVGNIQKEIDGLKTEVADAQRKYDNAAALVGNPMAPDLTQWWIPAMSVNAVERCQNCHAAINSCGFSQPHEVVEALAAGDSQEAVAKKFCLTPATATQYQDVASQLCVAKPATTTADMRAVTQRVDAFVDRAVVGDMDGAKASLTPDAQPALAASGSALKAGMVERFELNPPHLDGSDADVSVRLDFAKPVNGVPYETLTLHLVKGDAGWLIDRAESSILTFVEPAPADAQCVDEAQFTAFDQLAHLYCDLKHSALPHGWVKGTQHCFRKDDLAKLAAAQKASDPSKQENFHLPLWAQTHPYKVQILGTHPPEKFGCTTCHGGEGPQTKGVEHQEFQHGYDDVYWETPLANLVSYVRASDGKVLTHQKQFVESNCAKCHTENFDLAYAPTLDKGRKLVSEIGCYGCHPIDVFSEMRKPGPQLTAVQEKMTPGYIYNWVSYPRSIRPRTRMPNFWPEAVDERTHQLKDSLSPEVKLRQEEVTAITAYLWNSSEGELADVPALAKASPEHGKELVQSRGCYGCHAIEQGDRPRAIPGSDARDFAPNLWDIGDKANEKWIYHWVKNPTAMWAQTRMPNLRLSDEDAADIAAYLATKHGGRKYEAPEIFAADYPKDKFQEEVIKGKSLISKYGCFGCHDIKGFENAQKIGADLNAFGEKAVSLLDFGDAITDPTQFSWYNWVNRKLRYPRSYRYERVDTRMPEFDFTDDEVRSIMVFLKSLQDASELPESYLAGQDEKHKAIFKGNRLVDFYNCRGCHVVDGVGGEIRDRYDEDQYSFAPPLLNREGAKVQPGWVFNFLRHPVQLRPWLEVRMPTFPLQDETATDLVHYFAASADKGWPYLYVSESPPPPERLAQAKKMVDQLQCFSCHTRGAPPPDADRSSLAPNLELARSRLRPDWVVDWLIDPSKVAGGGVRMPQFWPPDDSGKPTSPFPDFFNGDAAEQMKAVRDYLFYGDLGATPEPAPKGKKTAMR